MADKKYGMVELESGTTRLTCWVDRPVAVGESVTLKTSDEPDRWWTVARTFSQVKTKAELSDQSKWEVGGVRSER
jgi:hypothetical protein